jgi:TonB family protein
MKLLKPYLFLILTVLLFSSCEKSKKSIEIVTDLESVYMNEYIVEVPAKEKEGFNARAEKDLIEAVKTLEADAPVNFKISLRVYINEDGGIDKIKDISGDNRPNVFPDSIKTYNQKNKLVEAVASKITDWQFEPAKDKGKNVKCWSDLRANILKQPDGTYKIEMPKFLNDIPDMNDFILVDKMPQVKNSSTTVYPEQAKRNRIEGTVYVKLFVNKDGKPIKSIVMRSDNEVFNQPALDAAMKFEFTPAVKDDRTLGVWVVVPFKFKLDK